MERRKLGKSDLDVSVIAMGTWAIGGPWAHGWGKVDDAESIRSIQKAIDSGINFIDTANVYGLGHSEEVIAQAIKGRRDEVVIATKVGATLDASGDVMWNSTPKHIFQEVEGSLKRLNTDTIDLYQIHWPDSSTPLAETMGAFNKLVEQGKIRYIGVSNFTKAQLEEGIKYAPIVSHQIRYNMLERDAEADILPFCIEHGIGTMVYGPLGHGLLAGEFKRGDKLTDDDWRSRYTLFEPDIYEKVMGIVDGLRPIAQRYQRSLANLTINWTLGRPGITTTLVGMRKSRHVEDNLKAVDFILSGSDITDIDKIIEQADLGIKILPPDEYLDQVKK